MPALSGGRRRGAALECEGRGASKARRRDGEGAEGGEERLAKPGRGRGRIKTELRQIRFSLCEIW